MENYSIKEHKNKFAAWVAARGTQRGFTTTKNLVEAIEEAKLNKIIRNKDNWVESPEEFDSLHKELSQKIMKSLNSKDVKGKITYGRVAKLIALYFKTIIVIGGYHNTKFAEILHPPIDSKLLENLSELDDYPKELRDKWKNIAWTKLTKKEYFDLINSFREVGLDKEAFWEIERFWTVY